MSPDGEISAYCDVVLVAFDLAMTRYGATLDKKGKQEGVQCVIA
jgi:hypothetical protein